MRSSSRARTARPWAGSWFHSKCPAEPRRTLHAGSAKLPYRVGVPDNSAANLDDPPHTSGLTLNSCHADTPPDAAPPTPALPLHSSHPHTPHPQFVPRGPPSGCRPTNPCPPPRLLPRGHPHRGAPDHTRRRSQPHLLRRRRHDTVTRTGRRRAKPRPTTGHRTNATRCPHRRMGVHRRRPSEPGVFTTRRTRPPHTAVPGQSLGNSEQL